MKKNSLLKPKKESHASSSKIGMGDFYGTGVKQNVGHVREDYMTNISKKSVKRPKTLA